ncbi:MAG TPA: hypothetical protein VF286_10910 [Acidiphilium sp.]
MTQREICHGAVSAGWALIGALEEAMTLGDDEPRLSRITVDLASAVTDLDRYVDWRWAVHEAAKGTER